MLPDDKVIISVDGNAGQPGTQLYDPRERVAQPGRNAEHGRSASAPSPGAHAGTASVEITPSKLEPHGIHTEGTAEWAGTRWEVAADKTLFLSARGGDGGAGGRGEDGQNGGHGISGVNATEHQDAQNGGPGERGGDAGYGTDGGNGGNGGVVIIEVSEHDTNLLLAVDWDVSGGRGGDCGIHGNPGEGGQGGEGGAGFTWQTYDGIGYACCGGGRVCTCQKYNQVNKYMTYNRPAGAQGQQGFHGAPPSTFLRAGANGAHGSVQIKVKSSNGMESIYPDKYHITVVSFELVDENGDGINEPGEHIIVRNICVQNLGSMPSPAHTRVPILINSGNWLDPLSNEPAYLPTSIFPGETVSVRGELRAFIRQEGAVRHPGVMFSATEQLSLTAVMPGVNRMLPDFFQPTIIQIGYPLELEPPRYLSSVERGNNVTFSWRLRNVSSKPYGIKGALRRAAGTCLSENGDGQVFTFIEADITTRGLDMLDALGPGTAVTIGQTFRVSDRADQYSTGALTLELLLSEPGDKEDRFSSLPSRHRPLRSIMQYPIEVQISARFSYNPNSSFLLVVNAETRPEIIHQLFGLMGDLKMSLDVWNLSVYGNFINPLTGQCVLFEYVGKSVIIFANPFEYFRQGARSAFGLTDPFIVSYLAAAGTQFLLPETIAGDISLIPWFSALCFPTYPVENGSVDIDRKVLIPTLNCEQRNGMLSTHVFIAKTQLLKNNKSVLAAETKRTAKLLDDYLPLHRFSVSPVVSTTKKLAGTVVVRQGLPRTTRVVATYGHWDPYGNRPSDFNTYMLIGSLPFKTRARMFWNRVGGEIAELVGGVSAGSGPEKSLKPAIVPSGVVELDSSVTAGAGGKAAEPASAPLSRTQIDEKIYRSLCLSIMYELELEVSRFCTEAPWPDVIPENNCLYQLSKIDYFLSLAVNTPKADIPSNFELMVETLGSVVAGVQPVGAGQFIGQKMIRYGNRRTHLRVQLLERLDAALRAVYMEKVAAKLKRKLLRASDKMKDEMGKTDEKTLLKVILSKVKTLTGQDFTSLPFFDASAMEGQSEAWEEVEAGSRMAVHAEILARIGNDEAHSRAMLSEMIKM